jgi:hypothetical protein
MRQITFGGSKPDIPWRAPVPSNVLILGNNYSLRWLMERAARVAPVAASVVVIAGVAYSAGVLIRKGAGAAQSYLPAPTAPLAQNTPIELGGLYQIRDV